jgi:hypothetical protein
MVPLSTMRLPPQTISQPHPTVPTYPDGRGEYQLTDDEIADTGFLKRAHATNYQALFACLGLPPETPQPTLVGGSEGFPGNKRCELRRLITAAIT